MPIEQQRNEWPRKIVDFDKEMLTTSYAGT